jgi:beta-glucosidase
VPSPFLWGVATSAYQIEGAAENDWTAWEAAGKLRIPGERCGRATDHRNRWRSDLALLPTIGANAYRYSIEWSRIEPQPGVVDEDALSLEIDRLDYLESIGVEPVVTLLHYTHPRWFWKDGGWENPGSVARFRRFVRIVADAFGGRVRWWTVLNEPIVMLLGGFLDGRIPPGVRSFTSAAAALENLLRAHVEAAAVLREYGRVRVGIAHNMIEMAPDRPGHALDRRLAAAGDRLYNLALIEAIATGRMSWAFPGEGSVDFRLPDLPDANDFVGLNYYSRVHLRFRGVPGAIGDFFYRDPEGRGLTDVGWEIHPEGFDRALRRAEAAGRPVVVTENGIATRDDGRRRTFLREHAVVLAHCVRSAARIEGYLHWSLLDNFEWLEGFGPRFGLFEVDYATFARRRRLSADLFAALGRGFTAEGAPPAATIAAGEPAIS